MDSNYSPEFNARPMSSSTFHTPSGSTVSIGDIYFILFRHKWKIIVLSLLGFVGAYALITMFPREYSSQARLFIRYVQEDNKPGPGGDGAIRSHGSRGENILAGEIAIVQSLDLAQKAADLYGPDKILDPKSESTNPRLAAASRPAPQPPPAARMTRWRRIFSTSLSGWKPAARSRHSPASTGR